MKTNDYLNYPHNKQMKQLQKIFKLKSLEKSGILKIIFLIDCFG
jgi:hypothetical protein